MTGRGRDGGETETLPRGRAPPTPRPDMPGVVRVF